MLRPATPLSILLFISFVLLLISTISTPIVRGIPIASYQGVNFGVFGWCKDSGGCSGVQVGWNTDEALPSSDDAGFNLSSSARHSLSSLLIVHPVAAFCNLIVLGLAVAAHLHSPSHSARYLLGLLILLLPTLLITLLAFLVDILLFVPHLQWGGWIVLASTILITASGVVTCAMRRTLVSRKARKKRIAENAEMSGANFYARQAEESMMVPQGSTESKHPMVNDVPGPNAVPTFTTYADRRSEERPVHALSPVEPVSAISPVDSSRYYGGQRSRSNSRPRQQDFSAPLGAGRSYENIPPVPAPSRGAYGPPRGRGYPPRGGLSSRGSYNSTGPPPSLYSPGRGGYPNRGRGGYPPGPAPSSMPPGVVIPGGMNRRPPPGYGPQSPDRMQGNPGPPQQGPSSYVAPGGSSFEPPSPSDYGPDVHQAVGPAAYRSRTQSPARRRQSPHGSRAQSPYGPRAQSPYGSRAQSPSGMRRPQDMPPAMPPMPDQSQYAPIGQHRTAPLIAANTLGMQRTQPQRRLSGQHDYVPPGADWSGIPHSEHSQPPLSVRSKRVNSGSSNYVEDVDPKFAEQPTVHDAVTAPSAPSQEEFHERQPQIPSLLMAGRHHNDPNEPSPASSNSHIPIPRANSYEDLHPGARSPVESEISNFTSVSQRPMNPNWQPGHGGEFNNFGPPRQRDPRRQDVLFSGNPDFEIPGMGPPRGAGAGRGGYRGRGGYSGPRQQGPMRPPPPSILDGLGSDGRYPGPVSPTPVGNAGGVMREI